MLIEGTIVQVPGEGNRELIVSKDSSAWDRDSGREQCQRKTR